MPIAAVALGICVIEKHFTLNKNLEGPDHKASLEPHELKKMIKSIRNIEKGLGNGIKKLTDDEKEIKKVARKSIVAKVDILKGTMLTEDVLAIKRPGIGIEPKFFKNVIGKILITDLKKDELLRWNQVK